MISSQNMNPLKIVGNTVEVECAVLYMNGIPVSAMTSNNSLWSAGQRAHAAKRKHLKLKYAKVTLSISWPMIRRINNAYIDIFCNHSRAAKKQREEKRKRFVSQYL